MTTQTEPDFDLAANCAVPHIWTVVSQQKNGGSDTIAVTVGSDEAANQFISKRKLPVSDRWILVYDARCQLVRWTDGDGKPKLKWNRVATLPNRHADPACSLVSVIKTTGRAKA